MDVKENQNWTVKWYKQILFRTIAKGEKRPWYRTGLSSPHSTGEWQFIAKERA